MKNASSPAVKLLFSYVGDGSCILCLHGVMQLKVSRLREWIEMGREGERSHLYHL